MYHSSSNTAGSCQAPGMVLGSLATLGNWATGPSLVSSLQSDDKDTEHIWRDGKMDSIICF